jgi:hypothetical protein
MGKGKGKGGHRQQPIPGQRVPGQFQLQHVPSLLDAMVDGREYVSIIDKLPLQGANLLDEVHRAITDIAAIRGRPCIVYSGNVVKNDSGVSGVDQSDDLPFQEVVTSIPQGQTKVDVLLSTRGGSGQQIARFVDCLRARFEEVDFLIPSYCFSAGTLFALSGDHIWMTPGACLGPIDPQVPSSSGRFVPAQALKVLVEQLRQEGEQAMQKGQMVPWTAVQIINTIDKRELGDAITATNYATTLAAEYLCKYKFKHWTHHSSTGQQVTEEEKATRAKQIADQLASHEKWNSHSHAISRKVLHDVTMLHIDHPAQDLQRALARAWGILTYIFERTPLVKIICSTNYRYAKQDIPVGG